MKTITFISAALVVLSSTVFAQKAEEKPYMTKSFPAASVSSLEVQTSGGGITVTGQGGEARVEVYIKPNGWSNKEEALSKAEIEERLKKYVLEVKQEGSKIIATAKQKSNNWSDYKKGLSIGFKVFVPEKITTDLSTSGGGISLKNLNGKQRFGTSGGGISLYDVRGDIKGETSGGGITLSNCADKIDLSTSGGGIKASNSDGQIHLSTSGGGISLDNLSGKIDASTSGGGVNASGIKGELITSSSGGSISVKDMDGSLSASTSGGGVSVSMKNMGKYLSLSTTAGNVRVSMPLNIGMTLDIEGNKVTMPKMAKFDGTIEKDHVEGKMNGGGIPVKIEAVSGNITINE